MDLIKAQRLLNKIQAFLDGNGHELSRLEKDLIKSYVQQLYEAVTSEETPTGKDQVIENEPFSPKSHKVETSTKEESPIKRVTEEPKAEPFKPIYSDYAPQVNKPEKPAYTEYTPPATKPEQPVYTEYMPPVAKQEQPVYKEYNTPYVKEKEQEAEKPKQEEKLTAPVIEEKSQPVHVSASAEENNTSIDSADHDELLKKLFDLQKPDETASRFGHVPIASIESAMGLNERIFTLNELFGGDKGLFEAWCSKLNSLNSFAEAKNVLMTGPAQDFKWADPERIKMAEHFLRIVSRRYPKSAS